MKDLSEQITFPLIAKKFFIIKRCSHPRMLIKVRMYTVIQKRMDPLSKLKILEKMNHLANCWLIQIIFKWIMVWLDRRPPIKEINSKAILNSPSILMTKIKIIFLMDNPAKRFIEYFLLTYI